MANIRVLSVSISGDKELVQTLRIFSKLVTRSTKTAKSRQQENIWLNKSEQLIADRLQATRLRGAIGKRETADYALSPTSSIVKLLYKASISEAQTPYAPTRVELKASTQGETTIGQITIGGAKKDFAIPGTDKSITTKSIYKKIGVMGTGYLVDLDPRLAGAGSERVTDLVFNDYFKKSPELFNMFYSKASTLLYTTTVGTDQKLVFLQTPRDKFTPEFFKATRYKKSIVISIRKSYFDNITKVIASSTLSSIDNSVVPVKETFTVGGVSHSVDVIPRSSLQGTVVQAIRSSDGGVNIKVPQPAKQPKEINNAQKFISASQWTALVQQRLGNSMLTFGDPEPPEIKERSGRFRRSVQVTANYRTKILQYTYNPLYRSLEHYGYHPELQVERAIREVAQQLYAREFSIIRRGGLA